MRRVRSCWLWRGVLVACFTTCSGGSSGDGSAAAACGSSAASSVCFIVICLDIIRWYADVSCKSTNSVAERARICSAARFRSVESVPGRFAVVLHQSSDVLWCHTQKAWLSKVKELHTQTRTLKNRGEAMIQNWLLEACGANSISRVIQIVRHRKKRGVLV